MILSLAATSHAQSQGNEAKTACGVAAATDYNKENLALLQQGTPLMSVEALITQRRLQEKFCLRFVRCIIDDPNSLHFKTAFDSCLRDEALEKYDAVPRDKN
jgi:hypothetical protein